MKKQIVLYLLLILAIFLISCNDSVHPEIPDTTPEVTPADTTDKVPEEITSVDESSAITVMDTEISTADCEIPGAWKPYYRLPLFNLVIAELGEFLELDASYKDFSPEDEYIGVAVNFVKEFENTFSRYADSENRDQRMKFVDSKIRSEISEKYDDIIIVQYDLADQIEIGTTALLEMSTKELCLDKYTSIPFSHIDITSVLPDGSKDMSDYELVLQLLPIVDNKVVIPEMLSKNNGYESFGYYSGYGNSFLWALGTGNENLTKIGRDDALFREGMTVEELDAYFELVTKKETFAPLFED